MKHNIHFCKHGHVAALLFFMKTLCNVMFLGLILHFVLLCCAYTAKV